MIDEVRSVQCCCSGTTPSIIPDFSSRDLQIFRVVGDRYTRLQQHVLEGAAVTIDHALHINWCAVKIIVNV